jgi:hypothetical protein
VRAFVAAFSAISAFSDLILAISASACYSVKHAKGPVANIIAPAKVFIVNARQINATNANTVRSLFFETQPKT